MTLITKLPENTVYVVDVHGFLHRFFNVTPGFAAENMMRKFSRLFSHKNYVLFAEDPRERGGTFRHELTAGSAHPYKGNRKRDPAKDAAFDEQLAIFNEMLEDTLGLPWLSVPGFEGDDIIATVDASVPMDRLVFVLGFDKDLFQLIGKGTKLWDGVYDKDYPDPDLAGPNTGSAYSAYVIDREEVFAKFGVYPHQMVDYQTLVGDSGDNLPGVRNIGAERAKAILDEFETLDDALESAERPGSILTRHKFWQENGRLWSALAGARETIELQRKLVTLRTDVPLPESVAHQLGLVEDS